MTNAKAQRGLIIAIDGPAGAGKSTVARAAAQRLGYRYINSGAMYRAVAWEALRRRISLQDPAGLAEIARSLIIRFRETPQEQRIMVQGEDMTEAVSDPSVSEAVSIVSAHPPVREVADGLIKRRIAATLEAYRGPSRT